MDMYTLLYFKWNSSQCYVESEWEGSMGRMDTCICVAESLHCSTETVTTLLVS